MRTGLGIALFLMALAMAYPLFARGAETAETNDTADFVGGVEAVLPACYHRSRGGKDFGKLVNCLKHRQISDAPFTRHPPRPITLECVDVGGKNYRAIVQTPEGAELRRNVRDIGNCLAVKALLNQA